MEPGVSIGQIELDGEERFQRLRAELGLEAFGLNVIRLGPRQRGRIHRHERQEEVYAVLEGTLTVQTGEEESFELPRGGVARVAPEVRRQLVNRGSTPVVLLAIGGHAPPHEGRDGMAYEDWDDAEARPPQEVPLPGDLPV